MLVETAIGDAYGMGFEYADGNLPLNTLEAYVKHPTHGLRPGQYTDDTQMTIAVAEALIEHLPFSREVLMRKFYDVFARDRRDGYSRAFQKLLETAKNGDELLALVRPDSDKSGGAMRAGPVGILPDPKQVVETAELQASVTHDTEDGRAAAAAAALMTHYFIYDEGPKVDLGNYLNLYAPVCSVRSWDEPWTGKVLGKGWMPVRAAITSIKAHDSLSSILRACIAFSGDVDTVGAIAMSAASCSKEIQKDLPEKLFWTLEGGKYGREFLAELDSKLFALKSK